MFINTGSGGDSSGGGETNITINGSTNSVVQTINDMQSLPSPKNGDICKVKTGDELYIHNGTSWELIKTSDVFYNKLGNTIEAGHVRLTSDITLDTEDVAVTPKALKLAMDSLKETIESNPDTENEWGDFNDGLEDDEGDTEFEWDEW